MFWSVILTENIENCVKVKWHLFFSEKLINGIQKHRHTDLYEYTLIKQLQ